MTTEQVLHKIYREESGKIISVLTKIFGATNLNLAEDVMQEAYIEALENWGNKIPENPTAWIYSVARNKALNFVNRNKYKEEDQNDAAHFLTSDCTTDVALDKLFSEEEIKNDQLTMMFICCTPKISPKAQPTLILKTLCGFGVPEISKVFLISIDTINKRLMNARKTLRNVNALFILPKENEINQRVSDVLNTIYLLFNEGYKTSQKDSIIRYELCLECIRLIQIILDSNQIKNKSEANALMALIKLKTARFISRLSEDGKIITIKNQDRSKWDKSLIGSGIQNLNKAMCENQVSKYLIMAAISANHCASKTYAETQWDEILSLYDKLVQIEDSPIVQFNRLAAKSMVEKN